MNLKHLFTTGCIAVASLGVAHAGVFDFVVRGGGVLGNIELTYDVNPNTGVLPGTSPNPVDPLGSLIVTGVSGTFADSNISQATTAITAIEPSSPANPETMNLLAPHSFGFFTVTHGVPVPGSAPAPGFSYDNLYYPGGSPQTASDYPFSGGYFDIYGLVFHTASGKSVNLWSNGVFGGTADYGVGVTDGTDVLDYVSGGVVLTAVPEPTAWPVAAGALLATAAIVRRRVGTRNVA